MKFSKKAEYALRALVAMARDGSGRTYSIQEIAGHERIPVKFLEQILLILKNGGLLRSKRGVGGGYQLARQPRYISFAEVLELVDGPSEPIGCSVHAGKTTACDCGIVGACAMGQLTADLRDSVQTSLRALTIAAVVERDQQRGAMMFEI
jgi:Rrf2 family transcriptional regulator, iron-sulfur cluster assembly transcription factor